MRTKIALLTSLVAAGAFLPCTAWAADEAPAATEPAPAPTPTETAPAEATPAATVEAPDAGPTPMPGWIRIDSDWGGAIQLWGGGTMPLTDSVGLAFDMYLTPTLGELDLGPAIAAGPVIITPMLGLQVDWALHRAVALVPQLYVTGGTGPIYGELWLQYYMKKMFAPEPLKDGTSNELYARLFVDYKLNDYVAVGPELDLASLSEADPSLVSLAIGPNVMLSNVGVSSTFMVFLGYETKKSFTDDPTNPDAGPNHLAGRFTFIHNF